jgi:hypothetical protein
MSGGPAASRAVLLAILGLVDCGGGGTPIIRVGDQSGAGSTTSGSTFGTTGANRAGLPKCVRQYR